MILVDTGPLVALFDPADACPVLTEAFHLLTPASVGSQRLMDFVDEGGLGVWFLDGPTLFRAFELMVQYANVPMDLADAALVAAAERVGARKVFTIDRTDFGIYRIRRGHRHLAFEVLG